MSFSTLAIILVLIEEIIIVYFNLNLFLPERPGFGLRNRFVLICIWFICILLVLLLLSFGWNTLVFTFFLMLLLLVHFLHFLNLFREVKFGLQWVWHRVLLLEWVDGSLWWSARDNLFLWSLELIHWLWFTYSLMACLLSWHVVVFQSVSVAIVFLYGRG